MNGSSSSTSTGLDHPRGIVIDQYDSLYIADNFNNRIQRWDPNSTFGITVAGDPNGTAGFTGGKIYYPTFVYVDSLSNMYILDNGNNRILKYSFGSSVGVTIGGTLGISLNSTYSFGQSWTMAVDILNNQIYIADLWYNRILVWPFFSNDSSLIIPLNDIVGIAMDSYGNIYATTHLTETIVRYPSGSTNGTVVISSGLSLPWSLKFDQYDNLYVTNTGSGTIVMFCVGFTSNTSGLIIASGLDQPVDIAFDSNMNLYVTEYGQHRVVKFNKLP